jgi:hypothetical protein
VLYKEFLGKLSKLLSFSVHADWGFLVFLEGSAQAGAKRAIDEYNVNLFVPGVNVGIDFRVFVYGVRPISPENWEEYGDARTLGKPEEEWCCFIVFMGVKSPVIVIPHVNRNVASKTLLWESDLLGLVGAD